MARDLTVNRTAVDSDKYVYREERDLSKTQVDWGTVSKNLTDTINTIRDNRQTEKDEIETANTEAMERAAEFDQYNNKTLNESVLEGSEWAREALSIQMDLTRRGLVTPSERKRYEQRVSDSFTSLKNNVNSFSKDFDESTRRANAKESTTLEQAINGSVAGLGVLKTWQLSGNTATGELAYVRAGNDPATGEPYDLNNPSNQASLGTIGVRVTSRVNYTSTTEAAQAEVEHLAEIIDETLLTNQAVKSVEDWRKLENSKGMMEGMVNSLTATPAQLASIAQDRLSFTTEAYNQDWTDEQLAADPDKVRLIPDPMGSGDLIADFSPEQIIRIKKAAELSLESQIDQKIKFTKGHAEQQDSPTTVGVKDRDLKAKGFYGEVVNLVTGSTAEATASATALASRINSILPKDAPRVGVITRSADGSIWTVPRSGEADFIIKAKMLDGSEKTSVQIIKELFEEVNPYKTGEDRIDVVMAQDAYGIGNVPTERQIGAAEGEVRKELIDEFDFNSSIRIDGQDVGPLSYLESKLGVGFEEVEASGGDVESTFKAVIDELLPQTLRDIGYELGATDADMETGQIQIIFGDRNATDAEDHYYTIPIYNKSIAETYTKLQDILNKERDMANLALTTVSNEGDSILNPQ